MRSAASPGCRQAKICELPGYCRIADPYAWARAQHSCSSGGDSFLEWVCSPKVLFFVIKRSNNNVVLPSSFVTDVLDHHPQTSSVVNGSCILSHSRSFSAKCNALVHSLARSPYGNRALKESRYLSAYPEHEVIKLPALSPTMTSGMLMFPPWISIIVSGFLIISDCFGVKVKLSSGTRMSATRSNLEIAFWWSKPISRA